jgi:hypothetical protein
MPRRLGHCVIKSCDQHHKHDGNLDVNQERVHTILHFYFAHKITVFWGYPHAEEKENSPEDVFKKPLLYANICKSLRTIISNMLKVGERIWSSRSSQKRIVVQYDCGPMVVYDNVYSLTFMCILLINVYLSCWSI